MKKIIPFIIVAAVIMLASCKQKKDRVEITNNERIPRTYVLDTLSNGHILMYEHNNHDGCCIEYPECPKCEQKLKRIIQETVDSILDVRAVENMAKGF